MQSKFASPIKGNNKGSSARLVNYLEKENAKKELEDQEYFFSADRNKCNKYEVISQIDNNAKGQGLEKKDDRFYSLIISPSKSELGHIGNDSQKLREYTRDVMKNYASGFNNSRGESRGVSSKDLIWYAKIETERKYNFDSPEVQSGVAKNGALKEGDQRHIHVVVSRCEARNNRYIFDISKDHAREKTTQLSPMVKNRQIFCRDNFYRANEQTFDKNFDYRRSKEESYDYCNALKNGTKNDYEKILQKDQIRKSKEKELIQSKRIGMSI